LHPIQSLITSRIRGLADDQTGRIRTPESTYDAGLIDRADGTVTGIHLSDKFDSSLELITPSRQRSAVAEERAAVKEYSLCWAREGLSVPGGLSEHTNGRESASCECECFQGSDGQPPVRIYGKGNFVAVELQLKVF
jgi:hypothetical protein